jgi:hypothetical protein
VSGDGPRELEDGWGPSTPPGDTVLRDFVDSSVHYLVDVGRAVGATTVLDADVAGAHHAAEFPFANMAIARRPLDAADWDGVLARLRDAFAGRGPFVVASPFATPDLRADGCDLIGHPPFMTRAAGAASMPAPEGLEITAVTTADEVEVFAATLAAAYPASSGGSLFTAPILDVDGISLWVARLDGDPVATALAHHAGNVNGVEMISCMPSARGRRVGEALTWLPTRVRPDRPAALIASDLGRPVYERMGFVALLRFTLWMAH